MSADALLRAAALAVALNTTDTPNTDQPTLTHETNNLLPALADEISRAVKDVWGADTDNFRELCLLDDMPDVVGQVVNRAFVGAPNCHNKTLVSGAVTFARGLVFTSVLLCCTPVVLRPLASLIMTLPQKIGTRRFFRELRPEVHRRIQELYANQTGKGENSRKYSDFLQWTIDAAVQSGDPYMMKPDMIMGRVLLLNFVSIHTSSFAIIQVLLDLAANSPDCIEELRTEIMAGLEKHGGEWNKRTLGDMPKLDSVFHESQRMNSIVTVASPKPVCNPEAITTPSGLHLPYGAYIGIPSYPILHDQVLYPGPETFRSFRFAGRREEADQQGLKVEMARQGLDLRDEDVHGVWNRSARSPRSVLRGEYAQVHVSISQDRFFGAPIIDPGGREALRTSIPLGASCCPVVESGKLALDYRDELVHGLVLFGDHQLRRPRVLRADNAAQVVPDKIDDHEVLGTFLRTAQDGVCEVSRHLRPLFNRALNGPELAPSATCPLEEPLGAAAHYYDIREAQERAERRWVVLAKLLESGKSLIECNAFIEEVLGLSTTAAGVVKETVQDLVLLGHHIPKGKQVIVPLWGASVDSPAYPVIEELRSKSRQEHARDVLSDWAGSKYPTNEFHPER
ncbi:hypothetical protein DL768_004113 [Monosporascus sp. mg162]|nr:hypothetical protein DL768_004113 [Monosporascus sp. mg162]